MGAVTCLLNLALILAIFTGTEGQHFNFETGITYNTTQWWAEGTILLTDGDLIAFEPKVIVNALQPLCSVDLTSCPPDHPPKTWKPCYCKSKRDNLYSIHVGSKAGAMYSGTTVLQARVPGYGAFRNISGTATIEILANNSAEVPRVTATYAIDDGKPRDLLIIQTLAMCPEKRMLLEICVNDSQPGATLKLKVDDQVSVVVGDRCILKRIDSGQTKTILFEYSMHGRPAQTHLIFIEDEDAQTCLHCATPSTSSQNGHKLQVPPSRNNYVFGFEYLNYTSYHGSLRNGSCCGNTSHNCSDDGMRERVCNTGFSNCAGTESGICDIIARQQTPTFPDANFAVFNGVIGYKKHTCRALFVSKMDFTDKPIFYSIGAFHDEHHSDKDSLIASWNFTIDWIDTSYRGSPSYHYMMLNDGGAQLGIRAFSQCSKSFYGETCSKYCKPVKGRYMCNEDGTKKCCPGLGGSECDRDRLEL